MNQSRTREYTGCILMSYVMHERVPGGKNMKGFVH